MKALKIVLSTFLLTGTILFAHAMGTKNLEWEEKDGKLYWYENGKIQGEYGDPKNVTDEIYNIERGREIYDPESDSWHWLDANNGGAMAVDKEVWIPYVYQDEKPGSTVGKWVRYDEDGRMIKGWYADGTKVYYYDLITGAMAKGDMHSVTWVDFRKNPESMEKDLAYCFDDVFGTLAYDAGYSYCSGRPDEDGAASFFFISGHKVSRTRTTYLLNSESSGLQLGSYEKINVPVDGWHFRLTDDDWKEAKNCDTLLYLDTKKSMHVYHPVFSGVSTITEKFDEYEIVYYDILDYTGLDQSLLYLCRKTSEEVDRKYEVELIGFAETKD